MQGGLVPALWNLRGVLQHRQSTVTMLWRKLGHKDSDQLRLLICTQGAAIQQQLGEKIALAKGDLLFDAEVFKSIATLFPMDDERLLSGENLPVDVSELGELCSAELECPGVYHLAVKPGMDYGLFPMEYYLVLDGAPISKEARGYGTPLENGQGLVFSLEQKGSGAKIIEYEIFRYRVLHHLPLPEGETLHGCAVYAAELYPEYFGMLPVPALTPWGYTTRHRALASGIYWVDTDQCVEALAVSHPSWAADLSGSVLRHACQTDYDTEHGINRTLGYKFFSKKVSCVVIFELLQYHSEWLTSGRVYLPALMNAILKYWPEYAVTFNAHEQAGLNDGVGLFLRSMGIEAELNSSVEHMITLTPGAGTDFLRW